MRRIAIVMKVTVIITIIIAVERLEWSEVGKCRQDRESRTERTHLQKEYMTFCEE